MLLHGLLRGLMKKLLLTVSESSSNVLLFPLRLIIWIITFGEFSCFGIEVSRENQTHLFKNAFLCCSKIALNASNFSKCFGLLSHVEAKTFMMVSCFSINLELLSFLLVSVDLDLECLGFIMAP